MNESRTERTFNDRYGTGQSALDGILRATNLLLAGRTLVLFGYGATGKGIAQRARGAGATVIVCEVDPMRALEARMDAFEVMPALEAAERGDLFVTVTGSRSVLRREHLERMRDGAVLANAGHFDVEIDLDDLRELAGGRVRQVLPLVEEFDLGDRRVHLLASGRVVNLAAGQGHPAAVMDMSFANLALAVEHLTLNGEQLENRVLAVPKEIDEEIARLKLESLGVAIDSLTPEQQEYLSSWATGCRLSEADRRAAYRPPMDTSKLTTGDIVAGVGGIVLLISLFLPWYGVSVDVAGFSASESGSGWEALGFIDILLFLISVVAIAVVAARAAGRFPADIPAPVILLGLGGARRAARAVPDHRHPGRRRCARRGGPEPQDRRLHRADRRGGTLPTAAGARTARRRPAPPRRRRTRRRRRPPSERVQNVRRRPEGRAAVGGLELRGESWLRRRARAAQARERADVRVAAQPLGAEAQQVDEVAARAERVRDGGTGVDGDRGPELGAHLGEQDVASGWRGAVDRRESSQRERVGSSSTADGEGGVVHVSSLS